MSIDVADVRSKTVEAVVTGIGIVAPTGVGADAHWRACLSGVRGIRVNEQYRDSGYLSILHAPVPEFVAAEHIPRRLTVQTDRWTWFGLAATASAIADAGVDPAGLPAESIGVVTGSSSGGNEFGQREIANLWASGPAEVSAYQSIAWFYAATTGQVSIRNGAKGPCSVVLTEQAAGLDALAQARREVRRGAGLMLAGGTEAPLSPYAYSCQIAGGLLSAATDPTRGYLPFDAGASGFVPGEGGAMFTVEAADEVTARGGVGYGRIAGYAAGFDAAPTTGAGLRRVLVRAMADAGCAPGEVGVVFADAMAVPELDAAEAAAISAVFGPRAVPVTAPKALTGRLYAGGSALDIATALLALRHQTIPPTPGEITSAYPELDLVIGSSRSRPLRYAVVLARGHGGFNSAMVLAATS
ncbi:beta-ketoacyl synthase N-terminal-like domain-containing protein [Nocardia iowensis]|uniref:Ketosynthase chain-length factor n=1 Tax=Nocardia iowensis TaxID=204891 RepID=A0ABX8RWS0_NOCIO|nr:beta-ketoacyl synthase N-terminal-like domain-containing protein [Nocardia iowensis]QXN94102.1 ketosynthase chain-length factor [Nocardia iowensis]